MPSNSGGCAKISGLIVQVNPLTEISMNHFAPNLAFTAYPCISADSAPGVLTFKSKHYNYYVQ